MPVPLNTFYFSLLHVSTSGLQREKYFLAGSLPEDFYLGKVKVDLEQTTKMVNHPGTSRELLPGKVLRDRRKRSYQQSLVGVRAWSRSWARGWRGQYVPAVKTVVGLEGSKKCFNWLLPCTHLPEPHGPWNRKPEGKSVDVVIEVSSWLTKKKNGPDGERTVSTQTCCSYYMECLPLAFLPRKLAVYLQNYLPKPTWVERNISS